MTFAVRRIRAGEWRAWRDFRHRALADTPEAYDTTLAESLARDDAWWVERTRNLATGERDHLVVAEDGTGRWLGCAGGNRDERSVQVISVWTAPEARGRGIGKRTCEAVVEWARQVGEPNVRLWVVDGNTAALALYRGMGFTPTGRTQPLRDLTETEYSLAPDAPRCLDVDPG